MQADTAVELLPPEPPTIVVFRRWRVKPCYGDILALFPAEQADVSGHFCSSYEHVGQHGSADYTHCIAMSVPATPEEYASLKAELEAAPYHYNLKVRRRYTRPRYGRQK